MSQQESRFLRINDVRKLVPISRPTIYRLMSKGEFPKNILIGSSSLWLETEIREWMQEKIDQRA